MSRDALQIDSEPLEMRREGPAVLFAIFVVLLFVGALIRLAVEACGMLRIDPGEA